MWTVLFKTIISALSGLVAKAIAYFVGVSAGMKKQKAAQDEADAKALRRAADAGAATPLDDASLRRSKYNRDIR